MATYKIEDTTLTNIADAIRTKGNTTASLTPLQMPAAINSIVSAAESGGGYDANDCDITTLSGLSRVSISASNSWNGTATYYTFTNWKDYFTSPEDIEILIFRASQNMACIYIKGLCPIYDNGYLGVARMNYSSSKTTVTLPDATYTANSTYSILFDDNGLCMTSQTISSGAGIYLVTGKEA